MADKLLDKWKNLSLMVEEANEITMGNALCSRIEKRGSHCLVMKVLMDWVIEWM